MKIIDVIMKNWMIYGGHQTVGFATGVENVSIIFGENMHGKTTLLNAIRWCLYGSAINRQGREMPLKDLINTIAQRAGEIDVSVALKFEVDESVYELYRKLDFSQISPSMTKTLKIDGRLIEGGKVEDQIEEVLPQQISQFMLFDGELLRNFENLVVAVGSAQATGIKNAIEETLGIPLLKQAYENALEVAKTLKKESNKELANNASATLIAGKIRDLELRKDTAVEEKQDLEAQRANFEEEINDLSETLHDTEQAVKLIENKKGFQSQLSGVEARQEVTRSALRIMSGNLWLSPIRKIIAPRIESYEEKLRQVRQKAEKQSEKTVQIMRLEKSLDQKNCPTCGSDISPKKIDEMQIELKVLKDEVIADGDLEELRYELNSKIRALQFLPAIADETERYKAHIETDKQHESDILDLENKILFVEQNLKGVDQQTSLSTRQKYDALTGEVAILKNELQKLEMKITNYDNDIQLIRKSTDYQKLSGSSDAISRTEQAEQIRDILSNAIALYRDELRASVESRATKTFKNLTTETTFDKLEINESYGLSLIVDGETVNRSAGAEQIVAMSLIEALNHHGRRKGPMIMDTPVGRLDNSHRKNILCYLPKVVTQLAIFAHSGEVLEDSDLIDPRVIGARYKIDRKSTFHADIIRL